MNCECYRCRMAFWKWRNQPANRAGRETFAEASAGAKDRTLQPPRPAPSADKASADE